jgi:hypothetical protein
MSNVLPVQEQKDPARMFGRVLEWLSVHVPPCVQWLWALGAPFIDDLFTFLKVFLTVLPLHGTRTVRKVRKTANMAHPCTYYIYQQHTSGDRNSAFLNMVE